MPPYCQDDPALARVIDEAAADVFLRELDGRTVREVPAATSAAGAAGGRRRATVLEIAALMARTRSPLVAVVDRTARMVGAVTLDALLDRMLGDVSAHSPGWRSRSSPSPTS